VLVNVAPTVLVLVVVVVADSTIVVVGVGIVMVLVYWPPKTVAGGRVEVVVEEVIVICVFTTAGAAFVMVAVCMLDVMVTVTVGLSAARR
jgi:hypothetical protein